MPPVMVPVINRLLRYVRIDTRSIQPTPGVEQAHPSCPNQRLLADLLKEELVGLEVSPEQITNLGDGSFLVHFPATEGCENAPHVVFASHLDTYFGCPGGANPIYPEKVYQGGDITLPNNGVVIPASDLVGLEGKRIITADGTTLLGADDKAGVAAIMTLIELIPQYAHGPFTVWFCTDEEIGEVGVKFLPPGVADTWDIFWTVDGKELNTLDVGCFYGAKVDVKFVGNDTHPGVSGQNLKPAHYAACRFVDKLAEWPSPWTTKDAESFIYVPSMPTAICSNRESKRFGHMASSQRSTMCALALMARCSI